MLDPPRPEPSLAHLAAGHWKRQCYNRVLNSGGSSVNERLKAILAAVSEGSLAAEAAYEELRHLPYEELGFAKIDHHRDLRDVLPEVVLAEGKTPAQIAAIGSRLAEKSGRLLVTRLDAAGFTALKAAVPAVEYHEQARVALLDQTQRPLLPGVAIVCAGTSDLPSPRRPSLPLEWLAATRA